LSDPHGRELQSQSGVFRCKIAFMLAHYRRQRAPRKFVTADELDIPDAAVPLSIPLFEVRDSDKVQEPIQPGPTKVAT
jgi:hypothetical protein